MRKGFRVALISSRSVSVRSKSDRDENRVRLIRLLRSGAQFNRNIENHIENLVEILVPENLIGNYFLVLKSQ